MKTPVQSARDFIGADALAGIGYEHDLDVATRAIHHDRTQRGAAGNRPTDVAQLVLDAHYIRDDWNRNGAQVRQLITEAIIRDRHTNLSALIGDLDVVRHHVDNTYEAADGDSNDAEIALLQEVRDLYEKLLVDVGGPWRDEWPDEPKPTGPVVTIAPLTEQQIATQASGGIAARWLHDGYTAEEADMARRDALGAVIRALRIVRGETVE